jgi:hypothetical protein
MVDESGDLIAQNGPPIGSRRREPPVTMSRLIRAPKVPPVFSGLATDGTFGANGEPPLLFLTLPHPATNRRHIRRENWSNGFFS